MRLSVFIASFVLGVLGGIACTPAKKCTPTTCTGCCTAEDTCEMTASAMACGKNGATCDRCVGAQVCSAEGRCEGASGGGSAGGMGGGSGGGSAGGSTSGNEITGTYQNIWGWDGDGGRTAGIAAFASAPVGVWYRDGGSPDFIRGTGTADGTFSVRNVPAGEVTLQLNRRYFVTTQRQLAFDSFVGGRRGATLATNETDVQVTVNDLEPIGGEYSLNLFFTQSPDMYEEIAAAGRPPAAPGARSVDTVIDWQLLSQANSVALPDSTQGDRGYALQFRGITFDGGSQTRLVRSGQFPAATIANGGSGTLATTTTAAATTATAVNFARPEFEALKASFAKNAGGTFYVYGVATSPATNHRFVGQGIINLGVAVVDEQTPLSSVEVANEIEPGWGKSVQARYVVNVGRTAADGGTQVVLQGGVTQVDLPANMTGAITPRISAVRNPQIAGLNLLDDQVGVSVTPTVSWQAPTTGTVSTYRVSILRITAAGETEDLWRIYTSNPAVTVPPGVLALGGIYIFEVEALSFGGGGISFTLPYAISVVVSGVIRP